MAITIKGSKTSLESSSSSHTIDIPTASVGDVCLVLAVVNANSDSAIAPAGWVELGTARVNTTSLAIFRKKLTSDDIVSGAVTFTTSSGRSSALAAFTFEGKVGSVGDAWPDAGAGVSTSRSGVTVLANSSVSGFNLVAWAYKNSTWPTEITDTDGCTQIVDLTPESGSRVSCLWVGYYTGDTAEKSLARSRASTNNVALQLLIEESAPGGEGAGMWVKTSSGFKAVELVGMT